MTPKNWTRFELPRHSRTVAVLRAVPSPTVVAILLPGVVAVFTGEHRWVALMLAGALYLSVWSRLVDRYDPECETADHWTGAGSPPAALAEECAYCRQVSLRELWRGDRR